MTSRHIRNLVVVVVSLLIGLGTSFAESKLEIEPIQQQGKSRPPSGPIRHDTKFAALPDSKLQIRAVEYDGNTNGVLKVQIKNTTDQQLAFSASGLYFVPHGDPDSAPQRLGAVGSIMVGSAAQATSLTSLAVKPGTTVEVALDVYCIDSHRSSPTTRNAFTVGKKRMPKELTRTIDQRATAAAAKYKADYADGAPAPAPAKSAIQSEVWRSRDAKWIELDGEGKQEAAK